MNFCIKPWFFFSVQRNGIENIKAYEKYRFYAREKRETIKLCTSLNRISIGPVSLIVCVSVISQ